MANRSRCDNHFFAHSLLNTPVKEFFKIGHYWSKRWTIIKCAVFNLTPAGWVYSAVKYLIGLGNTLVTNPTLKVYNVPGHQPICHKPGQRFVHGHFNDTPNHVGKGENWWYAYRENTNKKSLPLTHAATVVHVLFSVVSVCVSVCLSVCLSTR